MDVALLHNPKAGIWSHSRKEIEGLLEKAGYRPRYCKMNRALKDPDIFEHGTFVIVAGGDGSIRKAALRLMGTGRVLAPLPLGTANNIAHSLGITGSLKDIIAGWEGGVVRQIDMGLAEGPWGQQHFIEGAGFGLIAAAMPTLESIGRADDHEFQDTSDELHRDLCVYVGMAQALQPVKARIRVDGRQAAGHDFILFECLNIARAGPCIHLRPGADPGDGQFDVVSVQENERTGLVGHLLAHLSKPGRARLSRRSAQEVHLELQGGSFRVDDKIVWRASDRRKTATIRLSLKAKSLQVMTPAG